MQISRLFEIVYILMNRRKVSAKELAERLEVSVRTVYRDVDALNLAGVPIYATRGRNGGISINDSYVLNKLTLTGEEQDQILMALQSVSAVGHTQANTLLTRLGSFFDKDDADWIEVDFSRWGNTPHDRSMLATIKDAILTGHTLTFTYYSGNGERTRRTVYPTKLAYKSRAWYLQAFCQNRQSYRTFKINRMADVAMNGERFDRKVLEAPPALEQPEQPIDASSLQQVTLLFQPRAAWRVLDEFDPSQVQWNADGTMTVQAYYSAHDEWLLDFLLSLGTAVEIIEPESLRHEYMNTIKNIVARYENHDEQLSY